MARRRKPAELPEDQRCIAVTANGDWCRKAREGGHPRCAHHQKMYERMQSPKPRYYIEKTYKIPKAPWRKKAVIGLWFQTSDQAWNWVDMNWRNLSKVTPGNGKFHSVTVNMGKP